MNDEELLEELRRTVVVHDPPPPTLRAAARDAFGLERLSEELVRLIEDSDLQPAGTRGAGDVRLLSFATEDVEASVQVTSAGGAFDVTGVVTGAVSAIVLQTPAGAHDVTLDEQGRFHRAGLVGRMLRVGLRMPAGRTAASAWVLLG